MGWGHFAGENPNATSRSGKSRNPRAGGRDARWSVSFIATLVSSSGNELPYAFRGHGQTSSTLGAIQSVCRASPSGRPWRAATPTARFRKSHAERRHSLDQSNAPLTKDELRAFPWAKAVGEPAPCDSRVLFAPPSAESAVVPPIPPGIALHFLDPDFRRDVIERLGQDAGGSFLTSTFGVREFRLGEVIEGPVLGALQTGEQPEGTIEFLFALWSRAEKRERGDFDWTVPWRERLIRQCKVRCRDDEQRPALNVYAGSDWTGSEYLERCYSTQPDRTFLHPPPRR